MIPQIAPTGLRHRISSESIRPPSWKDGRTEICACNVCGSPFVARSAMRVIGKSMTCSKRCGGLLGAKKRFIDPVDRFWRKVDIADRDSCWLWKSYINQNGYGLFKLNGKMQSAHRVAVLFDDRNIPNGMVVDHICRNRACVNPQHLRIVTPQQNLHENSIAPAHINSLKVSCPKGHPYNVANTVIDRRGKRECRECRRHYQQRRRRLAKGGSDAK